MDRYNKETLLLIFLLLASNIVWGFLYGSRRSQLVEAQNELETVVQNRKILVFQKMFVEKVLKANGVVDFNTRVELQNAVTDIGDEAITETWNAFLAAKTESEGQNRVKDLLSLLASKAYGE